jgi:hypothetical protein
MTSTSDCTAYSFVFRVLNITIYIFWSYRVALQIYLFGLVQVYVAYLCAHQFNLCRPHLSRSIEIRPASTSDPSA